MVESSSFNQQNKGDELKRKLLVALDEANFSLSEKVQAFINASNHSDQNKLELLKAIIQTIDEVLSAGDWESSLFLRNQARNIKAIKEQAEIALRQKAHGSDKKALKASQLKEDEVAVFISLFQSEGYNLEKWAVQLRSLSRYVVGRPIYQNEADIQKRIRLRSASVNEAYVVFAIHKDDINNDSFGSDLMDQFDHTLLHLKHNAVQKGRIIAFVHQHNRYLLDEDGKLVKEE